MSKKQKSVAKSSLEAEYMGISQGGSNTKFLNTLVKEVNGYIGKPSIIEVDNTGAMFLANNDTVGPRTKHIDIHYHFVKDMIKDGDLELRFVRSDDNTADILTKHAREEIHKKHSNNIYEGVYHNALIQRK
jgi:hypothetical protein